MLSRLASGLGAAAVLSGLAMGLAPAAHASTTVTPVPPQFSDLCGSANDSYTVPSTPGVDYYVDGVKLNPGIRKVSPGEFVQVFTVAQPGYKLSQAATWSHTFDASSKSGASGCATPAPTSSSVAVGGTAPTATATSQVTYPSGSASASALPYTGINATGIGAGAAGLAALGAVAIAGGIVVRRRGGHGAHSIRQG